MDQYEAHRVGDVITYETEYLTVEVYLKQMIAKEKHINSNDWKLFKLIDIGGELRAERLGEIDTKFLGVPDWLQRHYKDWVVEEGLGL
jgi:hypothetical protein